MVESTASVRLVRPGEDFGFEGSSIVKTKGVGISNEMNPSV